MKKLVLLVILAFSLGMSSLTPTTAATPKLINYQGKLENLPVQTGPFLVVFEIFEDAAGGSALWIEQKNVTIGESGLFSTYLGETNPIDFKFDKQYYVQVTVGNNQPFPRTKLTSAPSAFYAVDADTAQYAFKAGIANDVIAGAIGFDNLAPEVLIAGGDLMGLYPNPQIKPSAILSNIPDGSITSEMLSPNISTSPSGPAGGDLTGTFPDPLIAVGAVKTDRIADGAVTNEKIVSLDAAKLFNVSSINFQVAVSVDSTLTGDGTVLNPLGLADDAVTSAKIKDGEVMTADLMDGSVTTVKIADLAVTNAKVAVDAINSTNIIDGQVMTADLMDLGVTTGKVADLAITTPKLADLSVTNAKLAVDAVRMPNIDVNGGAPTVGEFLSWDAVDGEMRWQEPTVVTSAPLTGNGQTGTPVTLDPNFGNVNEVLIRTAPSGWVSGLINTANLADGSVTTNKLATDAVTTIKITDRSVTEAKLADNSVITRTIMNDAVTTPKIADLAVTNEKVGSGGQPAGKVMKSDGLGGANWEDDLGIILPYSGSYDGPGDAFTLTHTGLAGDGSAAVFNSTTATNADPSVEIIKDVAAGAGSALSVRGIGVQGANYIATIENQNLNEGRALLVENDAPAQVLFDPGTPGNTADDYVNPDATGTDIEDAALVVRNADGAASGQKLALKTYGSIQANSTIQGTNLVSHNGEIIVYNGTNAGATLIIDEDGAQKNGAADEDFTFSNTAGDLDVYIEGDLDVRNQAFIGDATGDVTQTTVRGNVTPIVVTPITGTVTTVPTLNADLSVLGDVEISGALTLGGVPADTYNSVNDIYISTDLTTTPAPGNPPFFPASVTIIQGSNDAQAITARAVEDALLSHDLQVAYNNGNQIIAHNAEGDIDFDLYEDVDFTINTATANNKVLIDGLGTIDAQVNIINTSGNNAVIVEDDLEPQADNTFDLGSNDNRWQDVYVNGASVHIGPTGGQNVNPSLSTELAVGYAANTATFTVDDGIVASMNAGTDMVTVNPDAANAGGTGEFVVDAANDMISLDANDDGNDEINVTLTGLTPGVTINGNSSANPNVTVNGTLVNIDANDDTVNDLELAPATTGFTVNSNSAGGNEFSINPAGLISLNSTGTGNDNINANNATVNLNANGDGNNDVNITGALINLDPDSEGNINYAFGPAGLTIDNDNVGVATNLVVSTTGANKNSGVAENFVFTNSGTGQLNVSLDGALTGLNVGHNLGTAGTNGNSLAVNGAITPLPLAAADYELTVNGDALITGTLTVNTLAPNSVVVTNAAGNMVTDAPTFTYDPATNILNIEGTIVNNAGDVTVNDNLDVNLNLNVDGTSTFVGAFDAQAAGNLIGDNVEGTQLTVEGAVTALAAVPAPVALANQELIVQGDVEVDGSLTLGGTVVANQNSVNDIYISTDNLVGPPLVMDPTATDRQLVTALAVQQALLAHTLQVAYNNGETIVTNGNGAIDFTLDDLGFNIHTLDALTSTSGNQGDFLVDGGGIMDVQVNIENSTSALAPVVVNDNFDVRGNLFSGLAATDGTPLNITDDVTATMQGANDNFEILSAATNGPLVDIRKNGGDNVAAVEVETNEVGINVTNSGAAINAVGFSTSLSGGNAIGANIVTTGANGKGVRANSGAGTALQADVTSGIGVQTTATTGTAVTASNNVSNVNNPTIVVNNSNTGTASYALQVSNGHISLSSDNNATTAIATGGTIALTSNTIIRLNSAGINASNVTLGAGSLLGQTIIVTNEDAGIITITTNVLAAYTIGADEASQFVWNGTNWIKLN